MFFCISIIGPSPVLGSKDRVETETGAILLFAACILLREMDKNRDKLDNFKL